MEKNQGQTEPHKEGDGFPASVYHGLGNTAFKEIDAGLVEEEALWNNLIANTGISHEHAAAEIWKRRNKK